MADTAVLTISEFLMARIAEDEGTRAVPGGGRWAVVTDQEVAEAERWKAECEAKRRIVDMFRNTVTDEHGLPWGEGGFGEAYCEALQHLATVYADHPDYRQEWRP
jgi:hypothetical protein